MTTCTQDGGTRRHFILRDFIWSGAQTFYLILHRYAEVGLIGVLLHPGIFTCWDALNNKRSHILGDRLLPVENPRIPVLDASTSVVLAIRTNPWRERQCVRTHTS